MGGMELSPTIQAVCAPYNAFLSVAQVQALQTWAVQRLAVAEEGTGEETAVLTILRLVPQLLGPDATPDDEGVIDAPVIRLFKNLAWLAGKPANRRHKPLRRALQAAREQGDTASAFQVLLQILQAYDHI